MYGQLKSGGLVPPLCIPLCSGAGAPAGFPKEKAADGLGFQGGLPWLLFAPFGTPGSERVLRAEKEGGRASDARSDRISCLMRGQPEKHPVFPLTIKQTHAFSPFLVTKKGGKEVSGDFPEPPGRLSIFS